MKHFWFQAFWIRINQPVLHGNTDEQATETQNIAIYKSQKYYAENTKEDKYDIT